MTIAEQFIQELQELREQAILGLNYNLELEKVIGKYHQKMVRHELNFDQSISWYRDGSATWIGEYSKGIEIWLTEGNEGYGESKA